MNSSKRLNMKFMKDLKKLKIIEKIFENEVADFMNNFREKHLQK